MNEYRFLDYAIESTASSKSGLTKGIKFHTNVFIILILEYLKIYDYDQLTKLVLLWFRLHFECLIFIHFKPRFRVVYY